MRELAFDAAAGWLHFSTDQVPSEQPYSYPIFAPVATANPNPTGDLTRRYLPKASFAPVAMTISNARLATGPGATCGGTHCSFATLISTL